MAHLILIESDGTFKGALVKNSPFTFAKLKAIKEKDDRVAYEVDDVQIDKLLDNYDLEIVDGEVKVLDTKEINHHPHPYIS